MMEDERQKDIRRTLIVHIGIIADGGEMKFPRIDVVLVSIGGSTSIVGFQIERLETPFRRSFKPILGQEGAALVADI